MLKQTIKVNGKSVTRFGSRAKLSRAYQGQYLNDTNVLRPEKWAQESIRMLYEQMQYGALVYRNFNSELASFGETVHVDYPAELRAKRKQNDFDTVTDQAVTASKVDVKMNQRIYCSFLLGDGERTKSFKDLFNYFMKPQLVAQSRIMDRIIAGQVYQYMNNRCGALGQVSPNNASDYMLDARRVMNVNKVPDNDRWLGLGTVTESQLQKTDLFKSAERVGDAGFALREATLGRKHGFNTFLSLNTPSITGGTKATTTTLTASAVAGAVTIVVTSASNTPTGTYLTVAGDDTPQRVTGVSSTTLTISPGLLRDVANGATVTPMAAGAINQASAIATGDTTAGVSNGYPAGWMSDIAVDGTGVPQVGQLVSFKTSGGAIHTAKYAIVDVDGSNILLDRPLEQDVANDDIVNYGPNGDYNFFLQSNALALVNRGLALPIPGTGALAALGSYENMSLRTTMSYVSGQQATRVIVDCLLGVKPLQTERGGCMFG